MKRRQFLATFGVGSGAVLGGCQALGWAGWNDRLEWRFETDGTVHGSPTVLDETCTSGATITTSTRSRREAGQRRVQHAGPEGERDRHREAGLPRKRPGAKRSCCAVTHHEPAEVMTQSIEQPSDESAHR